jgi:hypothetical protein
LPSGKVLDERWDKNHDSNFFWSVGKEWQLETKNVNLSLKEKVRSR